MYMYLAIFMNLIRVIIISFEYFNGNIFRLSRIETFLEVLPTKIEHSRFCKDSHKPLYVVNSEFTFTPFCGYQNKRDLEVGGAARQFPVA